MEEDVSDILIDGLDEEFIPIDAFDDDENVDDDDENVEFVVVYTEKKKSKYDDEEEENSGYIETNVPTPEELENGHCGLYNSLVENNTHDFYEMHEVDNFDIEYTGHLDPEFAISDHFDDSPERDVYSNQNYDLEVPDADITVVKYDSPIMKENGPYQYLAQEIEFKNTDEGSISAYELTLKGQDELGIVSSYDNKFKSVFINEINGKKDGQDGFYWEVFKKDVNGNVEIAQTSIEKIKLNKGESLEWKYMAEEIGGCGGSSFDDDKIKNDSYKTKSYTINNNNFSGRQNRNYLMIA